MPPILRLDRRLALASACLLALAVPATAAAQDEDPDEGPAGEAPDDAPGGEDEAGAEVELSPDPAPAPSGDAPEGGEETPGDPHLAADAEATVRAEAAAVPSGVYPAELVWRPLTLVGGMAQARLDAGFGGLTEKIAYEIPGNDEVVRAGGVLRVDYGITDKVQLGLHYGGGVLDEEGNYQAGKTVALEAVYRFTDWAAAQVAVPVLLDPFSAAVTLGAPLKFRFGKLALFGGRDLITFRVGDYVPFTTDALATERAVAAKEGSGTILPDGDITVKGGAMYQLSPQVAVAGTIGVVAADFSITPAGAPLVVELTYASSAKLDFGANAGFYDLAQADTSAGVGVFVALRI
jgi:hypothetical protein